MAQPGLLVTPAKTRMSAKEAISSQWASRAELSTRANIKRTQQSKQSNAHWKRNGTVGAGTINDVTNQNHQVAPHNHNPENIIWQQVQRIIGWNQKIHTNQNQTKSKSKPNTLTRGSRQPKNHQNKSPLKKKISEEHIAKNKIQLANTLTQIRVSSALQSQLAEITRGESKTYLKSILSILPAGFDEISAITSSTQNRKRAFLLMDLGRVIRAHAEFITFTCGYGEMNSFTGQFPPAHKLRRIVSKKCGENKGTNANAATSAAGHFMNNVGKEKRKGVYIQPQFKVTKNPSLELLKLLTRLGVDLRCNSSDDVLAASRAVDEERKERVADDHDQIGNSMQQGEAMVLVDDVSKTRKPNGYFRRLLQARNTFGDNQDGMNHVEVAIDDVDEVHRISNTIQTFAERQQKRTKCQRNNNNDDMRSCHFILRLPNQNMVVDEDNETWKTLVLNVHEAASRANSNLVGVSVDLSSWSSILVSSAEKTEDNLLSSSPQSILTAICTQLRTIRLLFLNIGQYHIRMDLTGLPHPLNREWSQILTQTLKEVVCSNVKLEELQEQYDYVGTKINSSQNGDKVNVMVEKANDPSTCSLLFTADVSDHLVARAGALCTRIIGVKSGKKSKGSCGQKEIEEEEGGNRDSKQEQKVQQDDDDDTNRIVKHIYIDDGCYGSLGSSKCSSFEEASSHPSSNKMTNTMKEHLPAPLYGHGELTRSSKSSHFIAQSRRSKTSAPLMIGSSDSEVVRTTVWGPTCDGLDKVCESVMLPHDLEANRDWLVFTNLGCGGFGGGLGLGTAFNGFDPPDVAYCVLGYFSYIE